MMRRSGLALVLLVVLLFGVYCLATTSAHAERMGREQVPEPLRPWIDWVLHGRDELRCPFLHGAGATRQCTWPSRLVLELDDRGGRFAQEWLVERTAWVPLPGDEERWPLDVRVNGVPRAVTTRAGAPGIELEKGRHGIAGAFAWVRLPELLPIPAEAGLVALTLRGEPVALPARDPLNRLWLERRAEAISEESRLDLVVHRRVTDDVPLLLATRIELRVAGEDREIVLERPLPDAFVPLALASPLPARLEADGRLRMQVRPGRWTIVVTARHEGPAAALARPPLAEPWPAEEIWVFEARPQLRLVTVEGIPAIDPQQTELPADWQRLPAYRMSPDATMTLVEKRRGDSEPAPDRLGLRRTWWLDFDGGGYTVRDAISGTMSASWRLEMAPPIVLGRVAVGGRDQFITRLGEGGAAGVEVRQGEVAVEADGRLVGAVGRVPAIGWDHDFHDVAGELNLPPGWGLLHASGPDAVSSTWLADWTLLDLFLVLVVALAFARLAGAGAGLLALATLGLTYPEAGAPRWLWLAVLAVHGLARVVPEGRLAHLVRLCRVLAVAALAIVAVPFMVQQLRQGFYPALETPPVAPARAAKRAAVAGAPVVGETAALVAPSVRARSRPMAEPSDEARLALPESLEPSELVVGVAREESPRPSDVDPNAMISTGPGVPRWRWRTVSLEWRGPVERTQEMRLVLLSPRTNLLLACVRVLLLAALIAVVVRTARLSLHGLAAPAFAGMASTAVLGVLAVLGTAAHAGTDFPSSELLDELRARLTESPACFPTCASSARLRLEITAVRLVARLELAAAVETAVPLPGGLPHWTPERVLLDGGPAEGLARGADGSLWLRIPPGDHQVLLDGVLPQVDSITLPLPLRPGRVEARVEGWVLGGVREDGRAQENLELRRVRDGGGPAPAGLQPGTLPPFARVERAIRLGLTREVETRVVRLSPEDAPLLLEVPLLAGESVTTSDVRVAGGAVLVNLSPQVREARWRSVLADSPTIELRAPDATPWTEVWRLDVAALWHVETRGISVVHVPAQRGGRTREWRPWPGETVTVEVSRPVGVPGATLTIDSSVLELSPGRRATDATLSLAMRSSRGGEHTLTLPEGAVLESVRIDGATRPIRQEQRAVTIPLVPGSQQVALAWRQPQGIASRLRSPAVQLGAPSVNAEVRIAMPADRWTLLVGRALLGPAVLFWSTLAVVALVALGLGRLRLTPLGARHWFLLGIGLTQVDVVLAALVAGWLLALAWRSEHGQALGTWRFDLVQLLLVAWTGAALAILFHAIERGLLGLPQMQIAGNGSSAALLQWYWDRAGDALPQASVLSVPLAVYRAAMLAWALWVAAALLGWLRWGWGCLSAGGLWRSGRGPGWLARRQPPVTTPTAAPAPPRSPPG